jgi:uncharacterized heparinase superfamily protein
MISAATIDRYWQSLRPLQPHQIYGRILFDRLRPRPDCRPAPARRLVAGSWHAPIRRAQTLTGPTTFRFLNIEHELDRVSWDGAGVDLLWRFNQHYFDDLNAIGAPGRASWHVALLRRWLRENPPASGTGWRPYPTSQRIVNWVKWAMSGGQLPPECVESLAVQARWQQRRIEWHYLGNHLLANAKALVYAGCFFEGAEADEWRRTGLSIFGRQLPLQVLPDGGHYELSPMYQALVLEDLLDVENLRQAHPALASEFPAVIRESVIPMRQWLAAMSHPDGEISFFNDAAFGVAPSLASLDDYASRLGIGKGSPAREGCTWLRESGYVRLQRDDAVVIADVGRVCAGVCPAHAHADTLSFELSLRGRRLIVNTGVSQYGQGDVRDHQRGTASHSTVTVEDRDSSDVWGGFRVGHRARITSIATVEQGPSLELIATHDGYRRLPGRPLHRRCWKLAAGTCTVTDSVSVSCRAIARFHLAPGTLPVAIDPATFARDGSLVLPDFAATVSCGRGALVIPFEWCPEFGKGVPSACLEVPLVGGLSEFLLSWAGLDIR